MLDLVIVSRRWTAEECVRKFATTAAALGESATLSVAQLKRWRRGVLVTLPRPTACRVAEELFGHRIEDLLAPAVENPVGSGLCGIGEIGEVGEVGEGGLVGFAWLGDDEDMRRRAFLLTVAVLAELGRGDQSAALAAVRQGLVELDGQGALDPLLAEQSFPEGSLFGSGAAVRADLDADAWAELAFDYGERYPLTPAVRLFGPLAADFAYLQQALLHTADAAERRELNRAGALLAALLAQTVGNLAGPREAQRWWRTARHAAAGAGDPLTPLWVRARQVLLAIGQQPTASVLRLVEDSEPYLAGAAAPAALEFLGAKAKVLAVAGRPAQAERALQVVNERFDAADSGGYSGQLLVYGEERLRGAECFVFARLGDDRRLAAALEVASGLYRQQPGNLRWPAQNELSRAYGLVRGGDVATGTVHAQQTVARLPVTYRSNGIRKRAHEVLAAVPTDRSATGAARQYRDWLTTALPAPATRALPATSTSAASTHRPPPPPLA